MVFTRATPEHNPLAMNTKQKRHRWTPPTSEISSPSDKQTCKDCGAKRYGIGDGFYGGNDFKYLDKDGCKLKWIPQCQNPEH